MDIDLDDLLNNLNQLVEDFDTPDDPPKKASKPPPPPPPPKTSSLQFVPPPPPTKEDTFLPPPPPMQEEAESPGFPPPQITFNTDEEDGLPPPPDTFLPPPPPASSQPLPLLQDQEDLSAMIDDLETFSNTLSVGPSVGSNISGSNSGSINMAEDQFGTIRRTGASFVPPDFDDDMTLESLAKDIDLNKDEGLTSEAELAKMNPVMSELDSLAASLSKEATKATSLVASSTTGSSTASSRPPSTVSSGSSGLPRSIIKMPPPLPPKPGSLKYQRNTSVTSINDSYSASRDSIHSCSTTNSMEGHHLRAEAKTVKFAMPAQEVLSVDSGVDTLAGSADVKKKEETPEERKKRIEEDRVKIAMEKLKEARIQKLVVKVFNKDQSSKTMMIDERMTTRNIVNQLLDKNHFDFQPDWTLMEEIPSLYMERMFEEHEKPCDFLSYWTRDSTNQLRLLERKDKYALFKTPQRYLLNASDAQAKMQERQKQSLIEEFFSGGGNSLVPEVQGWLYMKGDSKSWSKKYCVLRSSGLYVNKGGEPKKGKKLSDLSSLVLFEGNQLYHGRGWRKKFKSPYDYGFAIKHPSIQVKSKQIKYFCCEDFPTYMSWTIGIRLAKSGSQLLENYNKTQEDVKSTSVVTSHLALRQAESEARRNSMTQEGSVRSTASGKVGVRGIFEGAWQRAEQQSDNDNRARTPSKREQSIHAMQQQQAGTNQPQGGSQESWWSLKPQYEGVPNMENQESEPRYSIPPPPSFNNNNSKNKNKNNNRLSSSSNPPPEFQPPPPQNKKPANKSLQQEKESPLTSYYSSQQKTNYKVGDFPPPPAFLSDLMAQFSNASKKVNVNEDDLIKDLPPPPNVVLNCIQTTRERKPIKKPPPPMPPTRSSKTKLSFKLR